MLFCALTEPVGPPDLEAVYLKYRRLMYATAGRFTQDPEDRQDVVQAAMERLLRIFSGPEAAGRQVSAGYVVAAVRSAAVDLLRRRAREVRHSVSLDTDLLADQALGDASLDDLLLRSLRAERLWAVWPELSEQDRLLLEGKYLLEMDDLELSRLLACEPDSVRMMLTRARRRALALLTQGGEA